MDGTIESRSEINLEKYNDYPAYMRQRFAEAESKLTNDYKERFQARKDAKLAREKALKAESSTEEQSLLSVPPVSTASDSEDPLQVWAPRKQPLDRPRNENPVHGGTLASRRDSMPAVAHTPAVNPASPRPAPKQAKVGETSVFSGSVSRTSAPPPPPKSRQSSSASETLAERRKRPADSTLHDDRGPGAPKQVRRTSNAASPPLPSTETARPTGADRQPPAWYKALPKPNGTRGRDENASETALTRLKDDIKKVKLLKVQGHSRELETKCHKIIEGLHKLTFLPVTDNLLRKTRMLDNSDGLPQLFDSEFSGGVAWPWYIKADAEELYNRWCAKIFETDLYRGLVRGGKGTGGTGDKLAKDANHFRLMEPKQHGDGLLVNGSWYPSQLAVLRDGGHGATQGGITANKDHGAYSVIMAGGVDHKGQPYPNEDRGNEVLYCGTDNLSSDDELSLETKAMFVNHKQGLPVRLFRSHNLRNQYAPGLGFRYDGLYSVDGYEKMDADGVKRNRHRFKLVRCAGQDPIRSEGDAKRPTQQEIAEYEKDKKNRGR